MTEAVDPMRANQERTAKRSVDFLAMLALALTLFAWAPLLAPFSFRAHDWRHALFYAVEFAQSVAEGVLVPRWGPDFAFGRGYPVFVFYSPLSLYIVHSFRQVGFGVVGSVKAAYVVGFLFGAAGMYRLARRWFGRQGALVATVLFTYLPYHLVDIYVRGALAEFWALAWFPWTFLAGEALIVRPSRRTVAAFGATYGGLVWLHSLSAILVTPFVGLFMAIRWAMMAWREDHKRAWSSAVAGVAGVGLGLWIAVGFLVPNAAEQRYIVLEQWTANNYQYDKQFVYPSQFLSPFWDFGYAVEGPNDGMAFQVGVVGVVTAATAVWLALRRALDRRETVIVALCGSLLLFVLWAMTPASTPLWRALPPLQFVQFPWRLLGVAVVFTAALGGAVGAWGGTTRDPTSGCSRGRPRGVERGGLVTLHGAPIHAPEPARGNGVGALRLRARVPGHGRLLGDQPSATRRFAHGLPIRGRPTAPEVPRRGRRRGRGAAPIPGYLR
ncbi:MAG: 6-pyruvoyl-tetrahydropterin synthase-related protein [Ardenticatenia bacterium]|nr:6-pyruvoyl-tetrahydropterin synthase-related protein [Ardenticatenia bacterium]